MQRVYRRGRWKNSTRRHRGTEANSTPRAPWSSRSSSSLFFPKKEITAGARRGSKSAPPCLRAYVFHPLPGSLQPAREGLGHFGGVPAGGALQRGDGGGLVEVDDRVELVGQGGVEVVAQALGLGSVDDADRPLQPARAQQVRRAAAVGARAGPQAEQERGHPGVVENPFVAVRQ